MVLTSRDEPPAPTPAPTSPKHFTSGSAVVLAFAALVIVAVLYFVLGMPGMDHSPSRPHDMENMQPSDADRASAATSVASSTSVAGVAMATDRSTSSEAAKDQLSRAATPAPSTPLVADASGTPPVPLTEAPATAPPTILPPPTPAAPTVAPPTTVEPGFVGAFDPPILAVGERSGEETKVVQLRLLQLGFWNAGPDGEYGLTTRQAVMAFQKYIGLEATGAVDETTAAYLSNVTVRARGQSNTGDLIEIDKQRQLLFIVRDGTTLWTLNTSTGNGLPYEEPDKNSPGEIQRGVALTPDGLWTVDRERPEGWWEGDLGEIYRPKYFRGGIAVHGSNSVPNYPASHGCVRVTVPAMDMIWEENLMPLGTTVWVHGG